MWPSLEALARGFETATVIGVDIPFGLPDSGRRRADEEARIFVGRRRSTVFPTPAREVLEASSYNEAVETSRRLSGFGISQQSWALRTKVHEANHLAAQDDRLREVHPEVTFCEMTDCALDHPKRSWNGQMRRRELLETVGVVVPPDVGTAGVVPVDDILDAAACAWTAVRIATGPPSGCPRTPTPESRESGSDHRSANGRMPRLVPSAQTVTLRASPDASERGRSS